MKKFFMLLAALIGFAFSPQTTPTITAAWTTICIEDQIGKESQIQFKVHNTGANPFTDCRVQSWVGPDSDDWVDISINWTACISLAADAMTTWEITGSSHEKLRVQVQSTLGTSAYCRPYGN